MQRNGNGFTMGMKKAPNWTLGHLVTVPNHF